MGFIALATGLTAVAAMAASALVAVISGDSPISGLTTGLIALVAYAPHLVRKIRRRSLTIDHASLRAHRDGYQVRCQWDDAVAVRTRRILGGLLPVDEILFTKGSLAAINS